MEVYDYTNSVTMQMVFKYINSFHCEYVSDWGNDDDDELSPFLQTVKDLMLAGF